METQHSKKEVSNEEIQLLNQLKKEKLENFLLAFDNKIKSQSKLIQSQAKLIQTQKALLNTRKPKSVDGYLVIMWVCLIAGLGIAFSSLGN